MVKIPADDACRFIGLLPGRAVDYIIHSGFIMGVFGGNFVRFRAKAPGRRKAARPLHLGGIFAALRETRYTGKGQQTSPKYKRDSLQLFSKAIKNESEIATNAKEKS